MIKDKSKVPSKAHLKVPAEISRAINLLDRRDKFKLLQASIIQILFGLLDLLGVAIIGMITAIAIRGLNSQLPGDRASKFLKLVNLENSSLQKQIVILGIFSVAVLTIKTCFSVIFLRKTIFYMSRKSAVISSDLISKLTNQPLILLNENSQQQRLFSLTTGVSNITVGVFTNLVIMISDLSLLLVLLTGLAFVDPVVCLSTLIVFSCLGLTMYLLLHTRAAKFGLQFSRLTIKSNQKLIETLSSIREITARGGREYQVNRIRSDRMELAKFDAELKFMPNISKYATELIVVIGITGIAAIQFARSDNNRAIAILSIFIAASTRIAPAVMRLQQSAITIKSYLGSSKPSLDLAEQLSEGNKLSTVEKPINLEHKYFTPSVNLDTVSFTYPLSIQPAIDEISLCIEPNTLSAFVGPSGGGKSTLVDLILGVIAPCSGSVEISKLKSSEALQEWPGAVGYVPQNVFITNTTIKENVCLGFNPDDIPDDLVWEALERAELADVVNSNKLKLDFEVGDHGRKLSGGQRQRLGIARALLTRPRLLILDEATSALDAETESKISESIVRLKESTTVLVVAHRLSTVRLADKIYYLDKGSIKASGDFTELKKLNEDFRNQANLMGL